MPDKPESDGDRSSAIFDECDILRRLADDRDLVQEVLVAFTGDIGHRLEEIEMAIKARDLAAVRRIVHTAKGAAANVSADALVGTARLVEAAIEQGDWKTIVEQIDELRGGVDNYRKVLRARGWLTRSEEKIS
jgi:HPt (histidine-containing phosphotransfer) domain-containing protein